MRNINWDGISPSLAGMLRGLVHAVVLAAVSAVVLYVSTPENVPNGFSVYVPLILAVLDFVKRTVEGGLDEGRLSGGIAVHRPAKDELYRCHGQRRES
ncbi:hypothetical protein GBA65_14815 [Rubrobacter marinus]|uniref:Uncharacterized protein n=1 Tax=Rubrobacter marinus TaxID=2653852 RepID=A0A6G8PZI1_9ACTN|nr:hypothetical protein [Rubrobacter marinus]QIN79578.1 hypothetical protein GBA65_14815 [Rubrobacter marinus]